MAFAFPASPSLNQVYSPGGAAPDFYWNGVGWKVKPPAWVLDAAADGKYYSRRNNVWVDLTTNFYDKGAADARYPLIANVYDKATADGKYLPLAGGTMTSALTLSGDPTLPLHAATRQYVDALSNGLDPKQSVRIATTAQRTLTGLAAIDGVTPVANDRVLVKDQTTASQNGIYIANGGAWTRALDFDAWSEIPGATVWVEEGTANADTAFVCVSNAGGTLNTTAISFVKYYGAGMYQPASAILSSLAALAADGVVVNTGGVVSSLGIANATEYRANTGGSAAKLLALGATQSAGIPVTTGYAASQVIDFSLGINFVIPTITGAINLANPTTYPPVAGRTGTIDLLAAADQALTFGSNWLFPGGIKPALIAAGKPTMISYYYAGSSILRCSVGEQYA